MRIITFGSCLSRFTAIQFTRLFGGEIISAVYHNRTDAFIGRFIEQDWVDYPMQLMLEELEVDPDEKAKSIDAMPSVILRNQYLPWLGLSRLEHGLPFFDALKSKPDLIIVDNHIDLGARLIRRKEDEKAGIFLIVKQDLANSPWTVGDYLPPEQSVANFQRLMGFFQREAPNATLAFINFPYNTYLKNQGRVERTKNFEKLFKMDSALVIPCLDVAPAYQTLDREHFRAPHYAGNAQLIATHLKAIGKGRALRTTLFSKPKVNLAPTERELKKVARIKTQIRTHYRNKDYTAVVEVAEACNEDKLDSASLYYLALSQLKLREKKEAYGILMKMAGRTPLDSASMERTIGLCYRMRLRTVMTTYLSKHAEQWPERQAFRDKYAQRGQASG